MHSNVNLESVAGALALFGTCCMLAALGLVLAYALWKKERGLACASLVTGLCVAGAYLGALLYVSLASREALLARGEEKYFCELDCHLAYSVVGVRRAKTLGRASAAGEFYVVTLQTRFDEETVSPRRADSPLAPNPRRVEVFDERGRAYAVSEEGSRALAVSGGGGTPVETPLRPGESYTTDLVFELPEGARAAALLVNESKLPTRFVIGHENSPLHAKTLFRLGDADVSAANDR